MSAWTDRTGLSSKQLSAVLIALFVIVGSVIRPDLASQLLGFGERLVEDDVIGIIEDYLDQGLGGSPWQTEKPCAYLVSNLTVGGSNYAYMLNGQSGVLEASSTDHDDIINWAIGNTSSPLIKERAVEKVILHGDFLINNPILMQNHTHFELIGRITLADNSDCHMMEFRGCFPHAAYEDHNWIVEGGLWDGNRQNQGDTGLAGIYFAPDEYISGVDYNPTNIIRDIRFRDFNGPSIKIGNRTAGTGSIEWLNIYDISSRNCRMAIDAYKMFAGCSIYDMWWLGDIEGPTVFLDSCGNMKGYNWYLAGTQSSGLRTYGCGELQLSDIFSDTAVNNSNFMLEGLTDSILDNIYIRGATSTFGYGINASIQLISGAGYDCTNNQFLGIRADRYAGIGSPSEGSWTYVIEEGANCENNSYTNINGYNVTASALKISSDTARIDFDTIVGGIEAPTTLIYARRLVLNFGSGTQWHSSAEAIGWNITANTNYASTMGFIPDGSSSVLRIEVYGLSWAADAQGMEIQISGTGYQVGETYSTKVITVASEGSVNTNFAANEGMQWVFYPVDDAQIGELTGGDIIQFKVEHDGADGANIETKLCAQCIVIVYV